MTNPYPSVAQVKHFHFVVMEFVEDDFEDFTKLYALSTDICLEHGATLSNSHGPIMSVRLGAFNLPGEPAEDRRRLVEALLERFKKKIRIAYGECDGIVANIGSSYRMNYDGLIPNSKKVYESLSEADWGTAVQVYVRSAAKGKGTD